MRPVLTAAAALGLLLVVSAVTAAASAEADESDPVRAARIHVDDLDGDGDMDLLMSSAHDRGVWWFENLSKGNTSKSANEKDGGSPAANGPQFKYHLIDDEISQTHDSILVDIDGDGQKDLVTGKRFFAHNGGDPGAFEPVVMVWYKIVREKGKPPRFIKHEIEAGLGTGIGTQFLVRDINGDGKPDIVLSNKKGVNVLLQK